MADKGMAEHHASVTVGAPVQQVYGLFTHFNDFPKFMSFVFVEDMAHNSRVFSF